MKRLREIRHGEHLAAEGIEPYRSEREREAVARVGTGLCAVTAEAVLKTLQQLQENQ